MSWTVYGDNFESGELSNTNKFQTIQMNKNTILKAIRTWVIMYNDPVITDLSCKIYSNNLESGSNAPGVLLSSSLNTLTKAEIITLDNGVKEIYFTFNDFMMNKDDKYNIVLSGTGYTPTPTSHVAWRKAWPKPVYSGYGPTYTNLSVAPYEIYCIGAEL